jgi:hypothetical protein
MRFVASPYGLEPFDDEARQFLEDQIDGEPIELEPLYPRDMIEHRRIMAIIGDIAKALHTTHENVRATLLYKTGHFTLIDEDVIDGKPIAAVFSMSRHHMREHELHAFWDEAQEVIREEILPRVSDPDTREYLAGCLSTEAA